jgi:hypothetical protein
MSRLSSGVRVLWPSDGLGPSVRWCGVFQVVKTAHQEDALSAPCLQHFRNYCAATKVARRGCPWEKTTKRPVAPRIACGAALAENDYVRLSSRKVACSSSVPPTSTGNPGSICINCETVYAVISALHRRALAGRRNAAERLNPSLLITLPFSTPKSSC